MTTDPIFRGREKKRRRELHEKYISDPLYVQQQLKNKTRRRTLLKQELVAHKGGKCTTCGGSFHPAAMDFHHVDQSSKEKSVAVLLGGSKEKALKEIEKCVLLCSNCHRTLHAIELGKNMTTNANFMYHPTILPPQEEDVSDWKWNDNIKGWVKPNTTWRVTAVGAGGSGGAKSVQVGGDHYKKATASNMQPWDIIDAWELDYYAGTVLKYLLRYKYKNGKEDLKKARHFLDKMIEDYDDNKNN